MDFASIVSRKGEGKGGGEAGGRRWRRKEEGGRRKEEENTLGYGVWNVEMQIEDGRQPRR